MTNSEFATWFADRGHKWCGAPTWNRKGGGTWSIAWHLHVGREEWSVGRYINLKHYHDHYVTDYEAACLVRDWLIFRPLLHAGWLSGLYGTREQVHDLLVAAVEAQMAEKQ